MRRDAAGRHFLLGDDRNAWRRYSHGFEDSAFRSPVADGDRGLILLGLDLEPGLDQLQYLRPGRARRDDQGFQQCCFVFDQRGAILIPPSRRMLSALR